MSPSDTPKPTEAELAILRVLWEDGPSTVRHVMERLNEQRAEGDRQTGYTTVLKFVQIMTEKGLLVRDDRQRTHVFHPAHPPGDVQDKLVGDLVDRAFGASAHKLVMHALASRKVSSDELGEIRDFLDQIEKERT